MANLESEARPSSTSSTRGAAEGRVPWGHRQTVACLGATHLVATPKDGLVGDRDPAERSLKCLWCCGLVHEPPHCPLRLLRDPAASFEDLGELDRARSGEWLSGSGGGGPSQGGTGVVGFEGTQDLCPADKRSGRHPAVIRRWPARTARRVGVGTLTVAGR